MKVRFFTTRCGPDAENNWNEGEIRNVSKERAVELDRLKLAAILEGESAAFTPGKENVKAEKAVVAPPEIAGKGKAKAETEKPVESKPASSDGAKPAPWGTGGKA